MRALWPISQLGATPIHSHFPRRVHFDPAGGQSAPLADDPELSCLFSRTSPKLAKEIRDYSCATRQTAERRVVTCRANPDPTNTRYHSLLSKGGESATRGHGSVQVACRPRLPATSPEVACGVAFKAPADCPRRKDSLARAGSKKCRIKANRNVLSHVEISREKARGPWTSASRAPAPTP